MEAIRTVQKILTLMVALNVTAPAQKKEPEHTATRVFVSPDKTFQFTLPQSYSLYQGKDVSRGGSTYIPICHDDAVVCAVYPENVYKGTTFEGASFEVKAIPAADEKACTPDLAISSINRSRTIGGIRFEHAYDGGGAMGHDVEINQYSGFRNGRCYELYTHLAYSNFHNYDPGAIKEFTKQDDERVTAELMKIVDSFKVLK